MSSLKARGPRSLGERPKLKLDFNKALDGKRKTTGESGTHSHASPNRDP